jgi:hypothetical protein
MPPCPARNGQPHARMAWGRSFVSPSGNVAESFRYQSALDSDAGFFLLSVLYQPLPLNTMPTG